MPIANIQDAQEVERSLQSILAAPDTNARIQAVRTLFVEILDYDYTDQRVSLGATGNDQLPGEAYIVARRDGVSAVYVPLDGADSNRVTGVVASAAAKAMGNALADEPLLLFTNRDGDQLHIIRPDLTDNRPRLQRIVAHRDQHQRTAVERIANMWEDYGNRGKTIGEAIANAFSVEPVTKEFFEAYREIFEDAKASITGFGNGKADQEDKHLFTQTLFNRLMFVYFLSRKGWLKFEGDTDYLNTLWRSHQSPPGDGNFYNTRLRPLFFSGLNNSNYMDGIRGLATLIGEVPFLNGGLFEETDLDRREGITVPDKTIEKILSGLFDRFNFTVMESTPFDVEVAVDPEMLGKVFEELVTARHDSGAYYTPRPVVSFMCREALKGYLEEQDTGLEPGALARFVDQRDPIDITLAAARRISDALYNVKVVDPACGSGAYLLGMMQELIELQTTLYNVGVDAKALYELKLEIIERNLYGVDIDEFAVNIAMLRMWLSLAIDYEGEKPDPLPNLGFKVVCGDSLLGPDPSASVVVQGTLGQDVEQMKRLGQLKAEYMRASIGADKDRLREAIRDLGEQVKTSSGIVGGPDGIVDWRIAFVEVFVSGGGFDVVLANPPYVVVTNSQLRSMYSAGVYGRMNLYGLFIQRSLQVMSEGAQLFFINPKTLLTDRYFTNLRKVIKQKSELKGVVLIADRHNTFDRVLQECIILHVTKKAEPAKSYQVNTRAISIPTDLNNLEDTVSVPSDRVLLDDKYDGSFYIGASDFDYRVFERMNSSGVKLAVLGLKAETGKIQFDKYQEYAQPTNADDACRLIWAENIQRYVRRESRNRIGKEWLANGITALVPPNITGMGIVTQRVTANEQPRRIIATLIHPDNVAADNVYSENHTNFIPLPAGSHYTFLLGVLNSSLMEFAFRRLNSNTQVSAGELNQLPLPPIKDEAIVNEVESLVFELLKLGGVDCQPDAIPQTLTYEHRLDILIGSLYGFSPSEVEEIQQRLPSYETIYGIPEKAPPPPWESQTAGVGRVATRGQAIYEEKIRHKVEDTERGKFAVIDIYSEDYEIDPSHSAATRRLNARHPGVITYTVRIGYPTAYKMGLRSQVLNA